MLKLNSKKQTGQAMIETAIMFPLLFILLLGVGYFGSVITSLHNLTVAARYAAREVSMDSTKNVLDRSGGTYFFKLNADKFKTFALQSLPGYDPKRLEAKIIDASDIANLMTTVKTGSFSLIPESRGYAYIYKVQGRADAISTTLSGNAVSQLRGINVGMGAVFFGVKLTYRLTELDWLSKFLFKKKDGVTIQAVSMMPAELPLRGLGYGLMNINSGLYDIVRVDVRDDNTAKQNNYEDLVK
ncbi:MAG: pilus assembly protein [Candidatus Sericytochromatia bacterium]|nr:pilus assembly protein [Candidatus Sericytochromatia bacterium]